MHDSAPHFAQPERRSFLLPVLLALAALGIAIALAMHFFPATTVNLEHVRTEVLPTSTEFKGSTIVGLSENAHVLFVASTIRVDNQLRVPIYVDDFHLTLDTPDGAQAVERGVDKQDLPDDLANFPALKPMLNSPLLRNTEIDAGKSATGTVLFALKIQKEVWDQRKSAIVKVDLYHQPSLYLTLPR